MKINGVNTNPSQVTQSQQRDLSQVQGVNKSNAVESRAVKEKLASGEIGNEQTFNEEMMEKSIEQANKTLEKVDRHIERTVHDVTHAIMYTIKDTKTDEVIGEFPPRKIQDMIAKMWELAGLFVDEKA